MRPATRAIVIPLVALSFGSCGSEEGWEPRGSWEIVPEASGTQTDGGPLEHWSLSKDGRLVLESDGTAYWSWPELDKSLYQPGRNHALDRFLEAGKGTPYTPDPPARHRWDRTPEGFVIQLRQNGEHHVYRRVAEDAVEWSSTVTTPWQGKPTTVRHVERWRRTR